MIFRFKKITKVNETTLYFCIKQEYQEFDYDHRDTNKNEKLLQGEQYFLYAFSDRKLERYEKEKVSSRLPFLERNQEA